MAEYRITLSATYHVGFGNPHPSSHDTLMQRRFALSLACLATGFWLGPVHLEAQPLSPGARAAVLAGALTGDEMHLFYGGEAGVTYWRAGLFATGFLGSGNDFDSLLIGIGPAFRIVDRGRSDLYVTAGAGSYRETLESGPKRSTTVFTGGLSGRIPAGPVRVAVSLLGWTGSFGGGGEEIGSAISVSGIRLAIGLGL